MNKIIFKIWLDAKRSKIKHDLNMGMKHSQDYLKGMLPQEYVEGMLAQEYLKGQLALLKEIEDDWNLEEVTEDVDYHIEKNF